MKEFLLRYGISLVYLILLITLSFIVFRKSKKDVELKSKKNEKVFSKNLELGK